MKVTATFESLEEFREFMMHAYIISSENVPEKKPESVPDPDPKAEKPKKEKKAEKEAPKEEPKAEPEENPKPKEEPKAEAKVDYDALRVECRKVLAELNKVTGKNTASEIIKSHGADKLTNVEDMFLPALLEEAREALNDAK